MFFSVRSKRCSGRIWGAVGLAAVLVGDPMSPTATGAGAGTATPLESAVLAAVRDARFGETIDFGPYEDVCPYADFCPSPARAVADMPNVDVAVIELDFNGRAVNAANVPLSRDYPDGMVVPIDRSSPAGAGTFGASSVRWRRSTSTATTAAPSTRPPMAVSSPSKAGPTTRSATPADDIVAGRELAPIEFMAPYPASLFKLVVAFRIMSLVDAGKVALNQKTTYVATGGALPDESAQGEARMSECPEHGRAPRVTPKLVSSDVETRTIADWMEPRRSTITSRQPLEMTRGSGAGLTATPPRPSSSPGRGSVATTSTSTRSTNPSATFFEHRDRGMAAQFNRVRGG